MLKQNSQVCGKDREPQLVDVDQSKSPLDAENIAPTPTLPSTPAQARPNVFSHIQQRQDPDQWSSPAFLKRMRSNKGLIFGPPTDLLEDDDETHDESGRKRLKFGIQGGSWRYVDRSPSPHRENFRQSITATFKESTSSSQGMDTNLGSEDTSGKYGFEAHQVSDSSSAKLPDDFDQRIEPGSASSIEEENNHREETPRADTIALPTSSGSPSLGEFPKDSVDYCQNTQESQMPDSDMPLLSNVTHVPLLIPSTALTNGNITMAGAVELPSVVSQSDENSPLISPDGDMLKPSGLSDRSLFMSQGDEIACFPALLSPSFTVADSTERAYLQHAESPNDDPIILAEPVDTRHLANLTEKPISPRTGYGGVGGYRESSPASSAEIPMARDQRATQDFLDELGHNQVASYDSVKDLEAPTAFSIEAAQIPPSDMVRISTSPSRPLISATDGVSVEDLSAKIQETSPDLSQAVIQRSDDSRFDSHPIAQPGPDFSGTKSASVVKDPRSYPTARLENLSSPQLDSGLIQLMTIHPDSSLQRSGSSPEDHHPFVPELSQSLQEHYGGEGIWCDSAQASPQETTPTQTIDRFHRLTESGPLQTSDEDTPSNNAHRSPDQGTQELPPVGGDGTLITIEEGTGDGFVATSSWRLTIGPGQNQREGVSSPPRSSLSSSSVAASSQMSKMEALPVIGDTPPKDDDFTMAVASQENARSSRSHTTAHSRAPSADVEIDVQPSSHPRSMRPRRRELSPSVAKSTKIEAVTAIPKSISRAKRFRNHSEAPATESEQSTAPPDPTPKPSLDDTLTLPATQIRSAALMKSFSTPHSYFTPLSDLSNCFHSLIDVLAIITHSSRVLHAPTGARDYYLSLRILDPSSSPNATKVQIFRPYKEALPPVEEGDGILLRSFKVTSAKRKLSLLSSSESGWVVWQRGIGPGEVREVCNGPLVEYADHERGRMRALMRWWDDLAMDVKLKG